MEVVRDPGGERRPVDFAVRLPDLSPPPARTRARLPVAAVTASLGVSPILSVSARAVVIIVATPSSPPREMPTDYAK